MNMELLTTCSFISMCLAATAATATATAATAAASISSASDPISCGSYISYNVSTADYYIPQMVALNRCQGGRNPNVTSPARQSSMRCVAVDWHDVNVTVRHVDHGQETVLKMRNETTCMSGCIKDASSCGAMKVMSNESWLPEECRCGCNVQSDSEKQTKDAECRAENRHLRWDSHNCACACNNEHHNRDSHCSAQSPLMRWNSSQCACVCLSGMKEACGVRGGYNFDEMTCACHEKSPVSKSSKFGGACSITPLMLIGCVVAQLCGTMIVLFAVYYVRRQRNMATVTRRMMVSTDDSIVELRAADV